MSHEHVLRIFDHNTIERFGRWTVTQILAAYLEDRRKLTAAGAYALKSLEKATRYCQSFADMFGKLETTRCERSHLHDWITEHSEWQATFTRRDAVGSVITAFIWAKDEMGIEIAYRRPRFLGPPVQPRPAITRDQFQAIRRAAGRPPMGRGQQRRIALAFRALLRFLWATGCRPKEARDAQWTMIDWKAATITLIEHKTVSATGEARVLPVRRVLPLLRWLLARRRPGQQFVFTNSLGRQWSCDRFAKEFRYYARSAGVDESISSYCCRHGLCSRLIEAGVGERQVADVLGHKSTRYVSWYAKSTRTKADHLNATLAKDRPPRR